MAKLRARVHQFTHESKTEPAGLEQQKIKYVWPYRFPKIEAGGGPETYWSGLNQQQRIIRR